MFEQWYSCYGHCTDGTDGTSGVVLAKISNSFAGNAGEWNWLLFITTHTNTPLLLQTILKCVSHDIHSLQMRRIFQICWTPIQKNLLFFLFQFTIYRSHLNYLSKLLLLIYLTLHLSSLPLQLVFLLLHHHHILLFCPREITYITCSLPLILHLLSSSCSS